ncbi:MAG: histidine kinase [Methylobacter sp.]
MNLQLHLLYRIAMVALLCLLVIASYALYQSHRQAEQTTKQIADGLGKQLESQLMLIEAGIGHTNPFPDFELWKQTGNQPGICVAYAAADKARSHSVCTGAKPIEADWPTGFETVYRRIFNPGWQAARSIVSRGRVYGSLTVTPSAELEIAEAWNKIRSLMALSTVTVSAVCLLVYLSISRALQPAQTIVAGLEDMETGRLAYRLPPFELNEWQRIAAAINQLATSQQQLLEERQKLVVKLINLQEEERRYLARELHDEFGQCLAAINAVAASIKQTAAQQCPGLIDEADHISRITAHMLDGVRDLLGRLRPAEFDELGLAASLNSLVAGWNGRGGKTRYRLTINGDCAPLREAQAVTLFRIAQECLTNIAKHAAASSVSISLTISPEAAILTVKDDGVATQLPFADAAGIGLLGIRERVAALHGQLGLAIAEPHGLIVEVRLPMTAVTEANA